MVKSYYQMISEGPAVREKKGNIWKIRAPTRVAVFIWLMGNRILTNDNLICRGWVISNLCYLFRNANEWIQHMFGCCQFREQVMQEIANQVTQLPLCQFFTEKNYNSAILESQHMPIRQTQDVEYFLRSRKQ